MDKKTIKINYGHWQHSGISVNLVGGRRGGKKKKKSLEKKKGKTNRCECSSIYIIFLNVMYINPISMSINVRRWRIWRRCRSVYLRVAPCRPWRNATLRRTRGGISITRIVSILWLKSRRLIGYKTSLLISSWNKKKIIIIITKAKDVTKKKHPPTLSS